jgi:hypothetical protein
MGRASRSSSQLRLLMGIFTFMMRHLAELNTHAPFHADSD